MGQAMLKHWSVNFPTPKKRFFLQTSLKWLTVAMPLLDTSKRQEREKTRERLERD